MLNKTKQKQTNKHTIIEKLVHEKKAYLYRTPLLKNTRRINFCFLN